MADGPMEPERLLEQLKKNFDRREGFELPGLGIARVLTPDEVREQEERFERHRQVAERNQLLTTVAMQVMQSLLMKGIIREEADAPAIAAKRAFDLAEAFLKERAKRLQVVP